MASKEYDVIIVGAGPTGIFTALELINKESDLKVVILEKGNNLKDRECPMNVKNTNCVKCKSCSIVSGWGGAGAFSDGKLSLSPDIGGHLDEYIGKENLSELIKYADKLYLKFGAPDRIFGVDSDKVQDIKEKAVKANLKFIPARLRHLGTGYSKTVLQAMQDFIAEKGVDIRFGVNVKELLVEDATIKGVKTKEGKLFMVIM